MAKLYGIKLSAAANWHGGCFMHSRTAKTRPSPKVDTMSQLSPATAANTSELPQDLVLLRQQIEGLAPEIREQLAGALARVVESTQRRRRILGMVQDALGQLRLDMKYLMFDLEATRRERDDYRSRLELS